MTIKSRLQISAVLAILLVLVLTGMLLLAVQRVKKDNAKTALALEIRSDLYERITVRDEYLVHHEQRSKLQWQAKNKKLAELINRAETMFRRPAEAETLRRLHDNNDRSASLFLAILTNRERAGSAAQGEARIRDVEEMLVSQLLMTSGNELSAALKLREMSYDAFVSAQNKAITISFILAVVSALAVATISLSMIRLITGRIRKLQEGAQKTAMGDLDHVIGLPGNDELGQLANSFDEMTAKLKMSYTSIENLNREIDARKRAEESARENEARLNLALGAAHMGVWRLDINENKRYFDKQVCHLLGINPESFTGTAEEFFAVVHADDRENIVRALNETIETAVPYEPEYRVIWPDDSVHYITARGKLVRDNNGQPLRINGVCWDITDRKWAEEALRERASLLDLAHDAIIVRGTGDKIVFWNGGAEETYGWTREEAMGLVTHDLLKTCFPKPLVEIMSDVVESGRWEGELTHIRKDGREIVVVSRWAVQRDRSDRQVGVLEINRDITERKRAEEERERLVNEMARSNRELEQFAYVASHDLQEPLRMVASYVQLLERKYKDKLDSQAGEYINIAVDGARRMQKLIEGLLVYSRIARGGAEFTQVNVNNVFEKAVSNLAVVIQENSALITKDDLGRVLGDESQLIQLFQNLISNAVKFKKPDDPPRVHVSANKKGREWVFAVRDNGIGISPEYFEKIFIIFQRLHTREKYPGTGIGLALCKRIVEHHQGRIWVESAEDKGTTFFFSIPEGGGK